MNDTQFDLLAKRLETMAGQRHDVWAAWLCELLRFETISGEKDPEKGATYRRAMDDCLKNVAIRAEELGLAFRNYDNRACVVEWVGSDPSAPAVGVALHLDVVPAGEGWKHPPFAGEIADGAIWGRGTQDDKGPVAMTFAAIDALKAANAHPKNGVRLLMGLQEETGDWSDVELLIANGEAQGPVLVPDGEYPIINGEKGMFNIEIAGQWAEPKGASAPVRFLSLRSGERSNMVPEMAIMRLAAGDVDPDDLYDFFDKKTTQVEKRSRNLNVEISIDSEDDGETIYLLEFHGKSAHGSTPERGHSAALDALLFLAEILPDDPSAMAMKDFVAFLSERASRLNGEGFDIQCHHHHLKDSTVNLGILDLSPSGGRAEINIRFPIGLTAEMVEGKIVDLVGRIQEQSEGLMTTAKVLGKSLEPLFVSADEHGDFLKPLQKAYKAVTGREAGLASIGGTTYAKAYPLAVAFGPVDTEEGDEEMAHEVNEHVTMARYLSNIRIYALALAQLTDCEVDEE